MRNIKWLFPCLLTILLTCISSFAQTDVSKFDEFGDAGCESEKARLDNFAVQLQGAPNSVGYVIVYGGRNGRHAEAKARASRIKEYLVKSRGLDANRVMTMDGGYMENLTVNLWIGPRGAGAPTATPTIQPKDVKFKKGKVKRSEYHLCEP
jgi:hypothetical protein